MWHVNHFCILTTPMYEVSSYKLEMARPSLIAIGLSEKFIDGQHTKEHLNS